MPETQTESTKTHRGNGTDQAPAEAEDVFANLDALRLDPANSLAGTQEVLIHVPARRPGRLEFVRTHASPEMSLATSIARQCTPEQARLILVDHRRSLLGALQSEHLIGYGATAAETRDLIDSVVGYLQRRLPGPEITPAQLRDRSWWTGPECFVLVDDYDLVAAGASNPIAGLLDFLAQARDVGLHLVLARRAGGAGRALYEPVIQRLREITTPGLLLSGEREEGALLGEVRPRPLPPGRAILVNRRTGTQLVQLGHLPPG